MPFRDAYKIVGKLVALCLELGTDLERLPLEKYREVSDVFAEDVYRAISLETCVSERKVLGGPSVESTGAQIEMVKAFLKEASGDE